MAFNLEDKIKWSELSPSLQQKFKDLETSVTQQRQDNDNKLNGIRISVSDTAPFNPKNNAELWFDTQYKVLRAYAENNWEFTRAAWYGGDQSGIEQPPTSDGEITPPEIPPYTPKQHKDYYMRFNETATSNSLEWNMDYCTQETLGLNVRHVFGKGYNTSEHPNKVTITINVSSLTTTGTNDTVAYLLAVTGNAAEEMEYGDAHLWPISKTRGNINETLILENGQYFAADGDSQRTRCSKVVPGNKPNDVIYGTIYFPAEFPYRVDVAGWNDPNIQPSIPERSYPAVAGSFSCQIDIEEWY